MTTRLMLAGLGAGAGLAYLLDPERGARRRAELGQWMVHATNLASRGMAALGRDAAHRTYGTAVAFRGLFRREGHVDAAVLVERVRARLGRLVSHSHAIHVTVGDGVVVLQGPILRREAARLVPAIRRVRGVVDVVDELARHEQADNVPSLIAWRTPRGAAIAHAGIVRFDREPDGRTRVHLRMSYSPPAGWIGHAVATAFGVDPRTSMDADLLRKKTLIETGHAPHDATAQER